MAVALTYEFSGIKLKVLRDLFTLFVNLFPVLCSFSGETSIFGDIVFVVGSVIPPDLLSFWGFSCRCRPLSPSRFSIVPVLPGVRIC